jgi:excisionase family DNA binding protein
MADLLTVRQLQELLHVDRTTIYHMLQEKRLPGFKVGGQWRFSREAIERWLAEQQFGTAVVLASSMPAAAISADVLPLHCLQPIQDVFADAMDVGGLTTTPQGDLLTTVSNAAPFCKLLLSTAEGRRRCRESWRLLGQVRDPNPALTRCHAGLCYARGRVEVSGEMVAMVFAGQFRLTGEPWDPKAATSLAVACRLEPEVLSGAHQKVIALSAAQAEKTLRLLQVVATTFSQIGQERAALVDRLRRISEMSSL